MILNGADLLTDRVKRAYKSLERDNPELRVRESDKLTDMVHMLHRLYVAILENNQDTSDMYAFYLSSLMGFTVATASTFSEAKSGPVVIWMPTWVPDESPLGGGYKVEKYIANTGFFDLNPDLLIVDQNLEKSDIPIDRNVLDDPRKAPLTGLEYAIYFQQMETGGPTYHSGESRKLTDIFMLSGHLNTDDAVRASQFGIRCFTKPVFPNRLAELAMSVNTTMRMGIPQTAYNRLDVMNLLAPEYLKDRDKPYSRPRLFRGGIGRAMGSIKRRIPMGHGAYVKINADDSVAFAHVADPNQVTSLDNLFLVKDAGGEHVVERMHQAYISFHRRGKGFPQPRYANEESLVLNTFLPGFSGYYFLRRIDDLVGNGKISSQKVALYKREYIGAVIDWSSQWDDELRKPTRVKDHLDDTRVPLVYTPDQVKKIQMDTAGKLEYVFTSMAGLCMKEGLFEKKPLTIDDSDPRLPEVQKSLARLRQAIDFSANLVFGGYGVNWKLDNRSQNVALPGDRDMTDEQFLDMLARWEREGVQRTILKVYGQYEIAPRCEDRFMFEDRISSICAPELGLTRAEQLHYLALDIARFEHKYRGRFSAEQLAHQWNITAEGGYFTCARNAQIYKALYTPRLVMAFWQGHLGREQLDQQLDTYQREQDAWFELKDWFAAQIALVNRLQLHCRERGQPYTPRVVEDTLRAFLTEGKETQYMRELNQTLASRPLPAELGTAEQRALAPYNFSLEFRQFYRPNGQNLVHRILDRAA